MDQPIFTLKKAKKYNSMTNNLHIWILTGVWKREKLAVYLDTTLCYFHNLIKTRPPKPESTKEKIHPTRK